MLAVSRPSADGVEERLRAALAARFVPGKPPVAVGRSGRTWLVDRGGERLVVKRFGLERSPAAYLRLFGELHQRGIAPRLYDMLASSGEWFAVFEFVRGELPTETQAATPWDVIWPQAAQRLMLLASCDATELLALHVNWMEKLSELAWHDGPAELLYDRLCATMPAALHVVAHGDFSPQNFACTPAGLVLIDWEEAGCAPAGFDAGWVLALTRLGVSYGRTAERLRADFAPLGIDEGALRWSVRLGLLRLFLRARTWSLPAPARAAMITRLRKLILDELNES